MQHNMELPVIDFERHRYPYCIVWTPIPIITWLVPFLGHMGIATSSGVIRDFAGPYCVTEDHMAFGNPTRYWRLSPEKVVNGESAWDAGVAEASEIYKKKTHSLVTDNCHSHVARALNIMNYDNSTSWNMVKLAFYVFILAKYTSVGGFLKTWIPFTIFAIFMGLIIAY